MSLVDKMVEMLEYSQDEVSKKFRWLSFIACIGVLMIHNRTYLTMQAPSLVVVGIQRFGSDVLARFAVPFFFLTSGFWFARKGYLDIGQGVQFAAKKLKTLLVPYLMWAIAGVALLTPLCVINNFITKRPLFDRTILALPGCWGKVDALLGVSGAGPIGDMPLWFIKSLLAIFLISPLFLLLRKLSVMFLWLLSLSLLFVGMFVPSVPCLSLSASFVGWFMLGIALHESGCYRYALGRGKTIAYGIIWVIFSLGTVAQLMEWVKLNLVWHRLLACMCNLCGVTFLWGVGDWLLEFKLPRPAGRLFWIYCFHQFVTSYTIATVFFLVGKNDVVALLLYFLGPFFYVPVCCWTAKLLERLLPRVYLVLAGGR